MKLCGSLHSFIRFLGVTLLYSATSLAQIHIAREAVSNTTNLRPLPFPADRNGLQVLPQRFEYTLLDRSTLRIGDIIINTNEMAFEINDAENNQKRLLFRWPSSLLSQGTLVLKNSNGKAIFSTNIIRKNLKSRKSKLITSEDESSENYRTDIGELDSGPLDSKIIDELKNYPFMTFCVFRAGDQTRTSLCSNEFFLSISKGELIIKPRLTTAKTSFVEINGKAVGEQGIIFLNDPSESVEFRTLMDSGSILEISTRLKLVDFKDVTLDTDKKRIILTASGTEPIESRKIQRLKNGDWQTSLPLTRPQIWLRGDGDIPMRQEFFVRGGIPSQEDRALTASNHQSRLFGSKTHIQIVTQTSVPSLEDPDLGNIEPTNKSNQFVWNVHNLPSGTVTRRYILLNSHGDQYQAAMDFMTGTPYLLQMGVQQ